MARTLSLLAIAGALLAQTGCGSSAFSCTTDQQCGANGTCEETSYCSFPDPACPSGNRYGDHAAAGFAGTCVRNDGDTESATGETGAEESTSDESSTGVVPDGPDPYSTCFNNDCEFPEAQCVYNLDSTFSMCSPPCEGDAENPVCPPPHTPGFQSACLFTSEDQTTRSCFILCDGAGQCPGEAVCTDVVCSFEVPPDE